VASVKPRPRFIPGNGHPIPIGKVAGCASELVWTQRLEDKFFWGSNSGRPVCSQTLYWLSYPSFLAPSVKRTVIVCNFPAHHHPQILNGSRFGNSPHFVSLSLPLLLPSLHLSLIGHQVQGQYMRFHLQQLTV
jgi:hypothetical protein